MVRVLAFVAMLVPVTAQAISSEELRLLVGDAEREKRVRASRVDPNDLSTLLPVEKPSTTTRPVVPAKSGPVTTPAHEPPVSRKYATAPSATETPDRRPISPTPSVTPVKKNDNVYVPPARYTARNNPVTSDAVMINQRRFGIRMGSWVQARLRRDTTSADPGLVEMELAATVEGDVRELAAGTLLFAEKAYNHGTKRLDLRIVKAITPDGEELELSGLVYDLKEHAGLLGIVTESPTVETVGTGVRQGLLTAGRVAARQMTGSDIVGTVAGTTAETVIDEKQTVFDHTQTQPYTIHVNAQDVRVRVEATF
ncbi:MAG: Uncharacterized protein FD165_2676 [Gammaproteobacteria bacterium]|nr:MAG: Uncharacterized protein FD165_2676 [Gammaproteobacteria bacterium]TND01149.1 MAG: Uncharacterized protein FD120_2685 [Gammaproteobacteria bacterium]